MYLHGLTEERIDSLNLLERLKDAGNIAAGAVASEHKLAADGQKLLEFVDRESPGKLQEARDSPVFGFTIINDVNNKLVRLFAPFKSLPDSELQSLSDIGKNIGSGGPKIPGSEGGGSGGTALVAAALAVVAIALLAKD